MFFVAFQVFECAGQGVLRDNSPVVTPRPHSTGKPVFRQTAGRNTLQQVYDLRHVRAVRLERDMHVRSPDVNCFQGAVLVMSNLDESATQEIPLPFVESHAPFALASCAFENCLVVLQIIEVAAVGISFRWRDVVFVFARAESARVAGKPRPVSRPRYQIPRMRHAITPLPKPCRLRRGSPVSHRLQRGIRPRPEDRGLGRNHGSNVSAIYHNVWKMQYCFTQPACGVVGNQI